MSTLDRRQLKILNALRYGISIALVILGLLILGIIVPIFWSDMRGISIILIILALFFVVGGLLWYRIATEKMRMMAGYLTVIAVAFFIILPWFVAPLVKFQWWGGGGTQAACDADVCPVIKRRVIYLEYFMLGITIVVGFLALGPIILARTIIGPMLQEFQYFAGIMLIVLIVGLMLLFPIDVMFETCTVPSSQPGQQITGCRFSLESLRNNGPILLRLAINMLYPPEFPT